MARVNVRIRPAQTPDVPSLIELLRATDNINTANNPMTGRAGDASTEHLGSRLRALIAELDRVFLLAVDDTDTVVGLLTARHDEVGAIDLTPVLHVGHLLVRPGARRRGVGRSLLAAAVTVADERGVEHVLVTAAAGSREGNRYLARIGFAPVVIHRIASTAVLRRSLGMADSGARTAVLRRARRARAQGSTFAPRAVRGA